MRRRTLARPIWTLSLRAALALTVVSALAACGDMAKLPDTAGMGPRPTLPAPVISLIPTVNIAPAKGWPAGMMPTAMAGLTVTAFATGLDHPRWVYTLPNGDVLVAESNAPPKPEGGKGIKGWVMKQVMGRAGAGVPSATRITLLRDVDGDGRAEVRTVFLQNLSSPFGMALVGNDFLCGQRGCGGQIPLPIGANQHQRGPGQDSEPAGRAHQPPLDQKPDSQCRRQQVVCDGGL